MRALNKVDQLVHTSPQPASAALFNDLLDCLEAGASFELERLYELNYSDFELALGLLRDWRLARFQLPKRATPRR